MNRKLLITIVLLLIWKPAMAQKDRSLTLRGKVSPEYQSNFIRLPDSLKLSDSKMNVFLNAEHRNAVWNNGQLRFLYEFRYHKYNTYSAYNRHDHLIDLNFQKPMYRNIKLHLSDEIRARFSSTANYSYYRNIIDIYLNFPITPNDRAYIGFQNWAKNYPETTVYQKYRSSRIYSKFNLRITRSSTLGLKFEFHQHEGNLYPGSTAHNLKLDLDGRRYVFQAVVDKVFNHRFFASFSYRFENDMPVDINDVKQIEDRHGDENVEDLLAEDSDLGYLKNQGSLSMLFKPTPRVSFMTFYLINAKNFKYWRIIPDGPFRTDQILFLSHILKIKLYRNLSLEFQHSYENNNTNLKFYEYHFNSYTAGLSVQF